MSRHNYTNPAFCQQSEFYQANSRSITTSPAKVHRSESIRSNSTVRSATGSQHIINYQQPPRLGPKPNNNRYEHLSSITQDTSNSGRYALVPVEEIPNSNKGRYAVLPMSEMVPKFVKSQDNLDRYASLPFNVEEPRSLDSTPFASLPPSVHPQDELTKISRAFSSDFGSKPFVIVDQKSQQRYAVVPTEENEELVDENHEIIQMHNGKAHRYAVIPTDEEETDLSRGDFELSPIIHHGYATIADSPQRQSATSTPQKMYAQSPQRRMIQSPQQQQQQPPTPQKNNLATQRLHELLSTPQKKIIKNGTPKSSPQYYTPPQKNSQMRPEQLTPKRSDFTPQKLQYEQQSPCQLEQRTTAVIIPRLAPSIYSETTSGSHNKSWNNLSYHKVANATATIGVVSLMLILCGAMNSGLCLYMVHNVSTKYFQKLIRYLIFYFIL